MASNYRTLHNDIGLIQRSNNGWDLWFDNGDTVKATDFHSLQVGIIIACLTSWNYMNRYGNPTYEVFGNRAYELLKANKGSMVAYKIQQYFIECLKRMRRVYEIVYLNVKEVPNDPYKYYVEFEVISISNQLVDGSFVVATDSSKSTSYIEYKTYMPYASNENPLQIDLWLKNEYGGGLEGEILFMYIRDENDEYIYKVIGKTDEKGYLRVNYTPSEDDEISLGDNVVYFIFRGNTTYNPCTSKRTTFQKELFEYHLGFATSSVTTSTSKATLNLTLHKTLLNDNTSYPMSNTQVRISGTDGRTYNALTDENGEASVEVTISESTSFTAYYGTLTDEATVTIQKTTPTLQLSQDFINQNRIKRLIVRLYDENNNALSENLEGLTITFRREDNSKINTTPILEQALLGGIYCGLTMVQASEDIGMWTAELNGNKFYNGTTETYEE